MSLRNGLFLALSLVLLGLPRTARGQNETVNSPVPNPARLLFQNGQYVDVTNSPRPQNLNPAGVNFSDCEQDLRLDFSLVVSGFEGAHLEVWAGASVDCSQDANRNQTSTGVAHPCWQVASGTGPLTAPSAQTQTISVFARDVLRYEPPPTAGTSQLYETGFHDGSDGESACHVQASDSAVLLALYFLPVDPTEAAVGTAYSWAAITDLVAPAPPSSVSASAGNNLLDVSWTSPQQDPDRVGFALWTAPSQSGACGSPELQDREWVLPPSGQGVSVIPAANLAGTTYDRAATTLMQTQVPGGVRYAAVVTSIDGSGNFGPPSAAACAEPTGPSTPPELDASSPSSLDASSPSSMDASSGEKDSPATLKAGCGCAAAGDGSRAWAPLFAAIALLATVVRRRSGTMKR
jgi:MYXO-CTERM domain-containing protein